MSRPVTRKMYRGEGMTREEAIDLTDIDHDMARDIATEFTAAAHEASKKSDGTPFGFVTVDQVDICRKILETAGSQPVAVDSPAYFARWYLHLHRAVGKHITAGRADLAALVAWEAGTVFARANAKWTWERAAIAGASNARRLGDIAKRKNERRQNEARLAWSAWCAEADRLSAGKQGLSKHREAQLVIERLGLIEKADTVARGIKKVRMAR